MQGVAFKFGERRDEWKCCFCCHVRTATIFLGLWHLLLHLLTLSIVFVIVMHPGMITTEPSAPALPTPLSSETQTHTNFSPNSYGRYFAARSVTPRVNLSLVVMLASFAITLLMVYGAVKGKPSYLMPFFCLQLFDFCVAGLTVLTYLCYLPDMHRLVADSSKIPFQDQLLQFSPEALASIVFLSFFAAMALKAYFIGVVWSCYKYLSLRLVSAQRTLHIIEPESAQDLLPDYESAIKFPPPPPPYNQAISHPTV